MGLNCLQEATGQVWVIHDENLCLIIEFISSGLWVETYVEYSIAGVN